MSGLKFLFMLFLIYLGFRSIMKKVFSAVKSEGGAPMKGQIGNAIERVKQEIEKARLEAEREAAGLDEEMPLRDDPWAEYHEKDGDLFVGDGFFKKEPVEEAEVVVAASARNRWDDDEDETPSLWDRSDDEPVARSQGDSPHARRKACSRPRRRRTRLKEAIVWKEILDTPVGLRP